MEYIRNNLSATKSAESTDLIALLQQLQFRLNSAQTTQQLGHELLDALVQALLHETPNRLIQRIRRRRSQHIKSTDHMTREQAQSDLATVRDLRTLARQKDVFRGHRKLDPYRQEIMQLHQVGASQHCQSACKTDP